MGGAILLAAIMGMSFLLIFLFFKLGEGDKPHYLLQLLILAFLLGMFLLIGKVGIDEQDYCSWNVANSTTSGTVTSYEYTYDCYDNTNSTATDFYRLILWIVRIIITYVVLYFIYETLQYFNMFGLKRKQE